MSVSAPRDLDGAWVRALSRWWEHYDHEYLRQALRRPQIRLGEGVAQLGSWDPVLRTITISRRHILDDPWIEVMETLRHEMAHQFVGEVLAAGQEPPHGPAFREACRRLRCAPRASSRSSGGGPAAAEAGVVSRVKKLLSLAGSANENEARAAMEKARRLLLKYNVELVEADGERSFTRRRLGPVKGRHASWELWLAMILNDFFFVEVLWARSYAAHRDLEGTVLEVYGTPANVDMAEYVHAYLTQVLRGLWDDYRRRRSLTGNRERMGYWTGLLQGFHEQLDRKERSRRARAASAELVWKGDARLQSWYRYHNPRVVTRRSSGVAASEAFDHGVEAGRRIRLRRPLARGGAFGGYLQEG